VLWLGGTGWLGLGARGWRGAAIEHAALWPDLLRGRAPPLYPGQSGVMLLTYPFLHAGPGHLLGNAAVLAWAGARLERGLGGARLAALWLATATLGTLPLLLSGITAPVVGASGALFGFLGAWIGGLLRTAQGRRAAPRLGLAVLGIGVLLPLVGPGLTGAMAWQLHLGGFAVGLILGKVKGKDEAFTSRF
jgi:membrane associated rhomboid family serine protease